MLSLIPTLIGFFLGLLGGGGTILAVPALVYLYGFEGKQAIASSLLIVGLSSLIISVKSIFTAELPIVKILKFAIPAIIGAYLSAKFLAIYLSGDMQLFLFAVLTIIIGIRILSKQSSTMPILISPNLIWIWGSLIGIITGIVGVGGGFLIVPALHYLLDMPMKQAVKSSLFIIALQSLSGFVGYLDSTYIDYEIVIPFLGLVLLGMFGALIIRNKINDNLLKKIFAILLILIGMYILFKKYT